MAHWYRLAARNLWRRKSQNAFFHNLLLSQHLMNLFGYIANLFRFTTLYVFGIRPSQFCLVDEGVTAHMIYVFSSDENAASLVLHEWLVFC